MRIFTHFLRKSAAPLTFRRVGLAFAFGLAGITAASIGRVGELVAQSPPQTAASGIAPEALAQIEALIRDKDARSPLQQKIDSQLLYELRMKQGQPVANGVPTIETDLPRASDGHLILDVRASVTSALNAALSGLGVEVISSSPAGGMLQVHINIDQVEPLAALPEVFFVQPRQGSMVSSWLGSPGNPGFGGRAAAVSAFMAGALGADSGSNVVFTQTGQGSRTSEGDITHLAFAARQAFGANGSGIKIGVLSNGVTNLAASQAAGDLGPVTVLPGQTGSGDEGTAMLEIIHDLAPGAQLYFATANTGITNFANNIRALRAAGCNIIVDDVFYFVETPFQDGQAPSVVSNTNGGVVIQAVNDVTASGALFFSSAGNSGNLTDGTSGTWEGNFVDGGATSSPLPAGSLHNFGGQNFDVVLTPTTFPTNLYWSDPLGASGNDYDLFRLNSTGTAVLASSTNIQSGTQDPYEQVSPATGPGQQIVIVKKASAQGRFLHLGTNRSILSIATSGEVHGHAAAAAAFGVAATPATGPFPQPFTSSNVIETFSSDGPRRVFFQPDGTAYTPGNFSASGGLLRQKPDITAADGVSVTGVGGFGSPFFGTSAAAPHAAAIAGLLLSANPALSAAQIRTILTSSALDIMTAGVDRDSGAGIIMANAAMMAAGVPGTAFLSLVSVQASDDPGNGNGAPEAGEGVRLTLPLANYGGTAATAISATLTSSTPGITITQPNINSYPNLAISASANGSPYRFTVASDFACPSVASFTLTASFSGGPTEALAFTVPIGPPPISISSTLDTVAPAPAPSVVTTTGLQTNRLFRDGVASTCGSQKATPALTTAGSLRFDGYAFNTCQNSAASCVSVTLQGANAINLFSAAYVPSFNVANLQQNYRADAGASGPSRTYSFDIPAGPQTVVVDVHEVSPNLGIGTPYTLSVGGACGGACLPPNHPPTAKAKVVTAFADNTCRANASVDNGSSDADGNPLTLTQSPPGPYPLGLTSVLLTVKDPSGATSQASGGVNVLDNTPPEVTGFSVSPSSLWPPQHQMVGVEVAYSASDTCSPPPSCVLSVASNQPDNGTGDGDTAPDWMVVDAHHIQLRAERASTLGDRIYTVSVTCTDGPGNATVRSANVLVPANQKK